MVKQAELSKVINVTLLNTPTGIPSFNVNSLAIFSNETPGGGFGSDGYKIYYSADDVATDFGSSSETYLQAVAVFAQNPNILSGGGYLVVISLLTVQAATAGRMTTFVPGAVEVFQEIDDGAFKVTIDGTEKTISSLDFTAGDGVEDLDDVATIIGAALNSSVAGTTCAYSATANDNLGGFVITSPTTGVNSKITKLSSPAAGTDISGVVYLNGKVNITIVDGQAAQTDENMVDAIARTKADVYYFGVISIVNIALEDAKNLATYMQTQDKMLFLGRSSSGEITTLFKWVKDNSLSHTRCLYYSVGAQDARVAVAAYASRLLSVEFAGSNTMATMNLKTLAGIDPDDYDSNIDASAVTNGFDTYISVAGDPCVISNGANGGYSDEIYGELWVKLAIEVAGFNYLKTTNTKIPQTEPGMDGLKGAYAAVMVQALNNGLVARGLSWTSPDTFGNPADFRRNILATGYFIYSIPVSQQDPADRAARKAPLVQIALKFSGAIHKSDVVITVN